MNRFEKYNTQLVQKIGAKEGPISPSITHSASFGYGSCETAEGIFDGSVKKPLYARVGNPTSAQLESVLAQMEGGVGSVATASGMAASALAVMSIVSAGDEVISIGGLFGGSYSLFNETLRRFGVQSHFFAVDDLDAIEAAINDHTKLIFLESVGNPNLQLPDIAAIGAIARKQGVALAVDNTVTPLCVRPLELGADIVIYSTTKLITGNASALGGAAIYRAINESEDKFKTERYQDLHPFMEKMGATALIGVAKKRAMRDLGMSPDAFGSYLTLLGLETLGLRMERIAQSVERVAAALHHTGLHVSHPSLLHHPHHERYKTLFEGGCGPLLTIDCADKSEAFRLLNRLKLTTITANIGDSRTLALHMASTIYRDFDAPTRAFLGITPGLIRVSIGLESPQDIIDDFVQAAT
ncbi:MAG: O-acetylhomoserine aminocarboxypropyltransferase/cysteine synthase [Campylobacterales bacterium]|nr:O-acetylhomoserine aminocarboxypropyltransferase/cysteine synthase [Campylobacterales bacterium]